MFIGNLEEARQAIRKELRLLASAPRRQEQGGNWQRLAEQMQMTGSGNVSLTINRIATLNGVPINLNGQNANTPATETNGGNPSLNVTIPGSSVDYEVYQAWRNAALKGIFILASAAMTIYTNDIHSGSPQEKINLLAGVPYMWTLADSYIGSSGNASPFAGDVTALYVTSSAGGQLILEAVTDPTV